MWNGTDTDIQLIESTDRGSTWSAPITVNDNGDDGTDQFMGQVRTSPDGDTVAVAFLDRRLACPSGDSTLSADVGKANTCIDQSIQFFKDTGTGLQRVGSNVRMSPASWDPNNPGSMGLPTPTPGGTTTFIGDYFGLALTNTTADTLSPSTSNFSGKNPNHDQQQIFASVPIPAGAQ